MKTIFKFFILTAAIFCVSFVPAAGNHVLAAQTCGLAQTQTFNFYADEPSDYQCIRPGVNGASGWCATNTVADQFCKTKGFDSSTTFTPNPSGWGGTIYNDCGINWNGSGFYVEPITHTGTSQSDCPAWATSITCTKGVTTCGANQTCVNNQCVDQHFTCSSNTDCNDNNPNTQDVCINPATPQSYCQHNTILCSSNADCSSQNSYIGSPFCQSSQASSIFQTFRTYICQNPGTANSSCVPSDATQKKSDCQSGQTCSGGQCTNSCNANDSKKCYNGNVYWYDSCNNRGDLFQTCNANQTCSNGQCQNQNIACTTASDCGTNGLIGSPFCTSNSVYQNYKTYICSNPGTVNSSCSNSTAPQLINNCTASQTCSGGSCVNQNIRCATNADCGANTLSGSPFCTGNAVYQNYITPTCLNPNTASSSCTNPVVPQLLNNCTAGQTCSNGSCNTNQTSINVSCTAAPNPVNVNQSVIFSCNVSGGTGNYTYSWSGACSSSSPTCTTVFSAPGTQTAVAVVTSGNQSNSASASVTVSQNNNNCGYHSYQQCSGNNLYWYNSCGVQQDLIQYCPNGCSGNSCSNNNCTQNSYQKCSGNYLYWYDSCDNIQGQGQFCPNGCSGNSCQNNYINSSVQTNPATNISNNQITLNGYLYNNNNYNNNNYNNNYCTSYVYFQWGSTTSYGNETTHQQQNYSGAFSQIVNLYNNYNNSTEHFRAAATLCQGGTVYGQDMTFSGNNYNNGNNLTVNKTVRNLSNGSGFASSTYANPSDLVMFMITLQATGGQDAQNVFVRDSFPSNLIYKNQLVVACSGNNSGSNNCNNSNYNYSGDITSGINLGTIYAGQTVTITYHAQLASAQNFSYGTTTLTNNVNVTSSASGYTPTSNASIVVTRTAVYGASTISTGLTNNFWVDSFFLPLLVTLILIWMWRSGMFFGIEKWISGQKNKSRGYKAEKELAHRITQIRKTEKA